MSSGQPEKPCDSETPTTSAAAKEPDSNVFVVEKIVDKRVKNGRLQYLVKWQGFPEEENTWEPVEGVIHCCDLLSAYEAELSLRSQGKKAKKHRKSSSKPKRRPSSSVPRKLEQPSGQEAELQAVIDPSAGLKRKLKPPIPRRHLCYLESSDHETNGDEDPIDLALERLHLSPVDTMDLPLDGGQQDVPLKDTWPDELPSGLQEWSDPEEDDPDDWRMPVRTKPFGMDRDQDLEKVYRCFKFRGYTFLTVTWKGCQEVDVVQLKEFRHAYPIPVLKFFQSLRHRAN
uniref:HP1D2 n=1 Tax=Drosophila prostipennis TaxID=94111 RepID=A0A142I120_9MUSC|nr:HP1D2 [Drosophila prostipennis]